MNDPRRVGSRSMTGRRRYGLGWLPWLLIALLLLLAAVVLIVVANLDDEDEAAPIGDRSPHITMPARATPDD